MKFILLLIIATTLLRGASGGEEEETRLSWSVVDFTPTLNVERRASERGIPQGYRVETCVGRKKRCAEGRGANWRKASCRALSANVTSYSCVMDAIDDVDVTRKIRVRARAFWKDAANVTTSSATSSSATSWSDWVYGSKAMVITDQTLLSAPMTSVTRRQHDVIEVRVDIRSRATICSKVSDIEFVAFLVEEDQEEEENATCDSFAHGSVVAMETSWKEDPERVKKLTFKISCEELSSAGGSVRRVGNLAPETRYCMTSYYRIMYSYVDAHRSVTAHQTFVTASPGGSSGAVAVVVVAGSAFLGLLLFLLLLLRVREDCVDYFKEKKRLDHDQKHGYRGLEESVRIKEWRSSHRAVARQSVMFTEPEPEEWIKTKPGSQAEEDSGKFPETESDVSGGSWCEKGDENEEEAEKLEVETYELEEAAAEAARSDVTSSTKPEDDVVVDGAAEVFFVSTAGYARKEDLRDEDIG